MGREVGREGVEPPTAFAAVFQFGERPFAIVRDRSPCIQIDPFGGLLCSRSFAQVRPNRCQTAVSAGSGFLAVSLGLLGLPG